MKEAKAADPRHYPRPRLQVRLRHDAHADVPSDGRLVIDKATHMGHLKGCLIEFCEKLFRGR
jgi:hypothetical protein